MSIADSYIVAGIKPWNRRVFDKIITKYPGEWQFISNPDQLTIERVTSFAPRYIFFLHWSDKVESKIFEKYECVAFHMTDLPFGRGGSPLQNLIADGHRHTKLSAIRLVEKFDAGPVYLKEDLCLEGNAEEIYIRASCLSADMIKKVIDRKEEPTAQIGTPLMFKRRKAGQSEIVDLPSLGELHDLMRMQDADGYPPAFLVHQGFRYEFNRAALYDGRILADVTITSVQKECG